MRQHFPKGSQLPALEQNILKYRAFEMVLILFHIQDLKKLVLSSIQATDRFRFDQKSQPRIRADAKNKYQKAWAILVADGIITQTESDDIQRLIDYRNHIAHSIYEFTSDLSREAVAVSYSEFSGVKYDYEALRKLKLYRRKISDGLRDGVISLSFAPIIFEGAERTYQQELLRLSKKIDRQIAARKAEHQALAAEIAAAKRETEQLDPSHPRNIAPNGKLTRYGIGTCQRLFDENLSPLAVAYLMRISYRAAMNRYHTWLRVKERA
ncbi:MAG: hypothetical protein ABSH08_00870 [Tepidisphaeraceae bacterium]|jgi:hypothetical protein